MMLGLAATSGGDLSLLGGGWQVRPARAVMPAAIAIVVRIPRKQAGTHDIRLELQDMDGAIVDIPPPDGPGPLVIESSVGVSGLKDPKLRTPLLAHYAVNLPPFPLPPGREFQWRLHVDGKTRPAWTLPFRTMRPEEEAELGPET